MSGVRHRGDLSSRCRGELGHGVKSLGQRRDDPCRLSHARRAPSPVLASRSPLAGFPGTLRIGIRTSSGASSAPLQAAARARRVGEWVAVIRHLLAVVGEAGGCATTCGQSHCSATEGWEPLGPGNTIHGALSTSAKTRLLRYSNQVPGSSKPGAWPKLGHLGGSSIRRAWSAGATSAISP